MTPPLATAEKPPTGKTVSGFGSVGAINKEFARLEKLLWDWEKAAEKAGLNTSLVAAGGLVLPGTNTRNARVKITTDHDVSKNLREVTVDLTGTTPQVTLNGRSVYSDGRLAPMDNKGMHGGLDRFAEGRSKTQKPRALTVMAVSLINPQHFSRSYSPTIGSLVECTLGQSLKAAILDRGLDQPQRGGTGVVHTRGGDFVVLSQRPLIGAEVDGLLSATQERFLDLLNRNLTAMDHNRDPRRRPSNRDMTVVEATVGVHYSAVVENYRGGITKVATRRAIGDQFKRVEAHLTEAREGLANRRAREAEVEIDLRSAGEVQSGERVVAGNARDVVRFTPEDQSRGWPLARGLATRGTSPNLDTGGGPTLTRGLEGPSLN